jgi:peptidoglycan/xylan/chitin deacetylase (PgdA/CDA1 family)
MKKKLLIITPILLLVGAIALWQIGNSRTFQFFGVIVPSVNTTEKIIALTFDDGPTATGTSEILKVLDGTQVKATFFLIGSELESATIHTLTHGCCCPRPRSYKRKLKRQTA